jgi:hypothetical protein
MMHTKGWRSRRTVTAAGVTAVLVSTGLVASGATAALSQRAAGLPLNFACGFPSGTHQVSTRVAATFPATATAGQPIQPTGAGIGVTVPSSVISYFRGLSASDVRLSAALGTVVAAKGTLATVAWQRLVSPVTALPAQGSVAMTAAGTVPTVTIGAAGTATFSVTGLSLVFSPEKADGQATDPASVLVECKLDAGQNTTLAEVPVTGTVNTPHPGGIKVGSQPGGPPQHGPVRSTKSPCPPLPKGGLKLNPRFPPPQPPKRLRNKPTHQSEVGCAYIAGFSNVRKLHESALVGPGLAKLDIGVTIYLDQPPTRKHNYFQQRSAGQLIFDGKPELPPANATLLAFGFMPVSATLQLSEIGTINAVSIGPALPSLCRPVNSCPTVTTVSSRVRLRIYNVQVNGVPLDVGPNCQTKDPFDIILTGTTPFYLIQSGGELSGTVNVPPFTQCGVGENLDSIFTASVSGPGNSVLLTQGGPCFVIGLFGCPPCKPIPQRKLTTNPVCPPGTSADTQSAGRQGGG